VSVRESIFGIFNVEILNYKLSEYVRGVSKLLIQDVRTNFDKIKIIQYPILNKNTVFKVYEQKFH